MSILLQAFLVFLGALGLSLVIVAVFLDRLQSSALARRIANTTPGYMTQSRRQALPPLLDMVNRWADRGIDLLAPRLIWPRQLSSLRIIGNGLVVGLLTGLAIKFLLAPAWATAIALGVVLAIGVMAALVRSEQTKISRAFEVMLADSIDMTVRMLRAGLPVTVAITRVGKEANEPAGQIYREASEWLSMGMPLPQAMRKVAERIRIKDFDFLSAALAIQSSIGGNLTETLDRLARIIRERNVTTLKARAVTAQSRMTANVILAILPTMLVILQLTQPEYLDPLIDGSHGYGLILFIVGSYVIAFGTIRHMISRVRIS